MEADMEISGISLSTPLMAISDAGQGSLQEAVGIRMLSKQIDMADVTGAGMVKMMEQSVNPYVGSNFDQYA